MADEETEPAGARLPSERSFEMGNGGRKCSVDPTPEIVESLKQDHDVPNKTQKEETGEIPKDGDETHFTELPVLPQLIEDGIGDKQTMMEAVNEDVTTDEDWTPISEPSRSITIDETDSRDKQTNMMALDEVGLGDIKTLSKNEKSEDEPIDRLQLSISEHHSLTLSSTSEPVRQDIPILGFQLECPKSPSIVNESNVEEESDTSEEQTELIVLDPDHPLMKRFQEALKNHLSKQLDKLTLEIGELSWRMKKVTTEREDIGVILYGVQQSLAQLQMELEKYHSHCSSASVKRRNTEEDLERVRNLYQMSQAQANSERSKVSQLQAEVENIALQHFYVANLQQDMCSDIMVMKCATEKLEAEKLQATKLKQKQDMFVDRLVSQMNALGEQIAMYEAQYGAQAEETKAARNAVAEASMEIVAINLEKRQLLEQWKSSLIGMQRRDEVYVAMQEAVRQAKQQVETLKMEIQAYKKLIMKQEERNEFLTTTLNRLMNDINMTQKLITQNLAKQEGLKHEYNTYTRTLQETERLLNKVTLDQNMHQDEVKVLRLQIEKACAIKVELEDKIMAKLQSKLTMNQTQSYLKNLANKLRIQKRQLEIEYANTEKDYAQGILDMNDRKVELSILCKVLEEQNNELNEKNKVISLSEKEIAKRMLVIQNKQSVLNMQNKKIAQLITEMGGHEMSPQELKIKTLTSQIEEHNKEIISMQQCWLRQQHELVTLTQEREKQTVNVELQRKQVTILEQKKIRTENMIQQGLNVKKEIERHMWVLSNDMLKLNTLLTKNNSVKDSLEQMNILMENEFVKSLKDAERQSIAKQQYLDQLKEEKGRQLNSLVEAERQIMLWEKKIQLAKEAKSAVDSEVGQGEIRAMKTEIHRMEIRYSQLMKHQEHMIRDMEAAIASRETILTRGEAQAKLDKKQATRNDYRNKIQDLCRKVADVQKNIEEMDKTIEELRKLQKTVCEQLGEKQCQIQEQRSTVDQIEASLESLQEKKRVNLNRIVAFQTRLKHLQAVKEGKYIKQCRSEETLNNELQKQESRIHIINAIIDRVKEEWPRYQGVLHKVTLALATRGTAQEGQP
ncbi:coiled-coil domain-containing protein 40 isoform X2 [Narcine bancroftii]|uniref:coiled-coil domain-containing protein 40 isoform X2 n=1 Tax=Narcine bancroftii TaxID=1343680 RepID=UPI003831DD52